MFYAIRHFTRYRYSHSVWQSMMEVRMHPRSEGFQRCFIFQLSVNPRARIFAHTDARGNLVHHFDLPSRHRQLTIISDALVNIDNQQPLPESMDYGTWNELHEMVEKKDYWDSLMPSHFARPSPELDELAREIGVTEREGRSPLDFLKDVAAGVYRSFTYVKKSTAVNSPIEHALKSRQGVCQDFAHIMIGCLRSRGLAARYVSGYLRTLPPPGADAAYVGADASHAWVSVFCPPFGWIDLDPTNDVRVSSDHIILAWGRDFGDVSPLRGVIVGGGRHRLSVRVSVQAE